MPDIKIKHGNTFIGQRYEAVIGSKVNWELSSSLPVAAARWKFNVMNCVVADYQQTDEEASFTPFSGIGKTGEWYWTAAGAITLTITAMVAGQTCSRSIEIKIHSPSLNSPAATGISVIEEKSALGRERDKNENRIYLAFKRRESAGFEWSGKVGCPTTVESEGKISALQLLTVSRTKTLLNNATENANSASYVLDQEVHYGMNDGAGEDVKTIPVIKGGSHPFTVDDSPATFIERRGERKYKQVAVDEQYTMFMMYKPKGGIWVAIGEVPWRWRAEAAYQDGKREWQVSTMSSGMEEITPNRLISCRLPVWTKNVAGILESDL